MRAQTTKTMDRATVFLGTLWEFSDDELRAALRQGDRGPVAERFRTRARERLAAADKAPRAFRLAERVREYAQACADQGQAFSREDVLLDVIESAPEVDGRRWRYGPEFGRGGDLVPTPDGVVRLLDGPPWAKVELP